MRSSRSSCDCLTHLAAASYSIHNNILLPHLAYELDNLSIKIPTSNSSHFFFSIVLLKEHCKVVVASSMFIDGFL